ncbi:MULTISPECIES: alkane 1-monooxygenase [unclassified Mycolicibacterium]|uniref:alkane 1-monooxygenase n=1 Tax=unclassified Mycolicibacterium TaxID=2636767 RepID=UPI0012DD180B|nr:MULTISPECIES: alkane 1-monooxygenase [unclassified Mycolicibacterium]MUL81728.1 alkane 1-monooxygenase [Mycolicibacterium sp. CBMA 329]MUL87494.1 alkane 1-monooxygenase [Mycolicibacterium sp. CBMA 331]MUL99641.1 alkane 1-monooxygenase [Mycolicibacterium sp. CBMA 334]MUM26738.1 alkane 1-monooxygenase [Mycolicibacterium sp. CBMA 295]MUM37791.1 alkane 1-monooxygenase [Mycolicibacterium sp. CBMA 247]
MEPGFGEPGSTIGDLGNRERWHDPKRYLWLLASVVPCLVMLSWLAVKMTGLSWFWWLGPVLTFVLMPMLDHIVGIDDSNPPESAYVDLDRDYWYRWATYLYLPNQYLSLIFACWLWSGGGWVVMSAVDRAGLLVTVGIVGGIGINAAHEMGHKNARLERRLSKVALAQTCYGHFFVEHNRGHHVRVATPDDPASSLLGQSLYRFIPRSVIGGLRSAWELEARRFARRGQSPWTLKNTVLNAWLTSAVLFAGLAMWFGPVVLPLLLGQAIIGFSLLESVNYLEHYGLRRECLPNGRYERVSVRHSWNGNTLVANVFLFHLQRHSDHHANPQRRYQNLRSLQEAPQLPAGYGAMLVLALIPPLWRRVMDPRVLGHYEGRIELAALDPRHRERLIRDHELRVA